MTPFEAGPRSTETKRLSLLLGVAGWIFTAVARLNDFKYYSRSIFCFQKRLSRSFPTTAAVDKKSETAGRSDSIVWRMRMDVVDVEEDDQASFDWVVVDDDGTD